MEKRAANKNPVIVSTSGYLQGIWYPQDLHLLPAKKKPITGIRSLIESLLPHPTHREGGNTTDCP